VHFPFSQGCPVIIQTKFEPDKFCAVIQRFRVTHALVVPPVLVVLARHPGQYSSPTILCCIACQRLWDCIFV
jgi:acyl-coenzyme A synthetase/AMP-(fatty) acid ligase